MNRGFTLIELLVVISIIAVLASMVLSSVALVRRSARSAQCQSNLRQLGMAVTAYGEDRDGYLVSAQVNGAVQPHWHELLAPYLIPGMDGKDYVWTTDPAWSGSNVLRGCPAYQATAAYRIGYGINARPRSPEVRSTTHWLGSDTDRADALLSRITRSSRRVLIGDLGTLYDDSWLIGVNKNAAVWDYADPKGRHGTLANWLFFDGHVGAMRSSEAAQAVFDPAAGG